MILVCPLVENHSVVWSPHQVDYCAMLERVDRKLIRLISVRCDMEVIIEDIKRSFYLLPLVRRDALDALFLYRLVNGYFHCPELLAAKHDELSRSS